MLLPNHYHRYRLRRHSPPPLSSLRLLCVLYLLDLSDVRSVGDGSTLNALGHQFHSRIELLGRVFVPKGISETLVVLAAEGVHDVWGGEVGALVVSHFLKHARDVVLLTGQTLGRQTLPVLTQTDGAGLLGDKLLCEGSEGNGLPLKILLHLLLVCVVFGCIWASRHDGWCLVCCLYIYTGVTVVIFAECKFRVRYPVTDKVGFYPRG